MQEAEAGGSPLRCQPKLHIKVLFKKKKKKKKKISEWAEEVSHGKSTGCFYQRPWFTSQHLLWQLTTVCTPVPGDLTHVSGFCEHQAHMYTHTHELKINKSILKIWQDAFNPSTHKTEAARSL